MLELKLMAKQTNGRRHSSSGHCERRLRTHFTTEASLARAYQAQSKLTPSKEIQRTTEQRQLFRTEISSVISNATVRTHKDPHPHNLVLFIKIVFLMIIAWDLVLKYAPFIVKSVARSKRTL